MELCMSDERASSALDGLVAALPEHYQPIFGHPEHSAAVARECHDRLEPIIRVYKVLEAKLQRPLRVLDLGCAQGFFSLSLAELGATVHGVDYFDGNVAVCNALAEEYRELEISFQVARIEEVMLDQVGPDQYDLVLGLSVFHHIVYEKGAHAVRQMLDDLAHKVVGGIFELALASEPPYWAAAQPQEPSQLLSGFAFVHELAQHKTHLSGIPRPLYFASNRYWYLNDQVVAFDSWQAYPHVLAQDVHQGTRRYYFGEGLIAKFFRLDHAEVSMANLDEHRSEVTFLRAPPPGIKVPQLLMEGRHEHEVWLVRELLPGELLVDIIRDGKSYDVRLALQDVLTQLVALESVGLYHSDLRAWNVLVNSEGHAQLIDYGSIAIAAKDCVWPYNIFLAFLIFVYEVSTGRVGDSRPLRTVAISPYRLDQPYRKWMTAFWSYPTSRWSFKTMHQLFEQMDSLEEDDEFVENTPLQHWMQAIEDAMEMQMSLVGHVQRQQQQIEKCSEEKLSKLFHMQAHADKALARIDERLQALKSEFTQLNTILAQLKKSLSMREAESVEVYSSRSWRTTLPRRVVDRLIKQFRRMIRKMHDLIIGSPL
ncbi:MAG: methyltransferase domain-containing protein [candidate division NC10 bacterium]|nr:methyltransferase domain-containing protein [candidate division NC10 bacterium]